MDPKPLTLILTIEDTNLILEALGDLPFARVYLLINAIQMQASGQIAAPASAPPDTPRIADTPDSKTRAQESPAMGESDGRMTL